MSRIAVIGAGVSGLICAFRLAERGHNVTVFERTSEPGGLAASFQHGDATIDRHFHFICPPDAAYLQLLDDLGCSARLRWRRTTMGVFRDGEHHRFGTPGSLLAFTPLTARDRIRFALATLRARSRSAWEDLDSISAREWLVAEQGERCYDVVWRPLLEMKFGDAADRVSAAWMWARIDRVARSRRGLLGHERLGYLEGGTATLVRALIERIEAAGGAVHLGCAVHAVAIEGGRVTGIETGDGPAAVDGVVSTIAPPALARIAPGLPGEYARLLGGIEYLGVADWVLLSEASLGRDFWLNTSDARVPFPGVITYSKLDPLTALGGLHLHYVPQYLSAAALAAGPATDDALVRVLRALDVIRPGFSDGIAEARVFVERWAQPVYDTGYARRLGAHLGPETPVAGLWRADMSQVYPHDRSIVNAAAHATRLARALGEGTDGILR